MNKHLHHYSIVFPGNKKAWWFEEPQGLVIGVEFRGENNVLLGWSGDLVIPWRTVRAALKRKDKPRESARATTLDRQH